MTEDEIKQVVRSAMEEMEVEEQPEECRYCNIFLLLFYLIGAFGTFAWVYEFADIHDGGERMFGSALAGIIWPVFWAGKGSLDLMHSLHTPPVAFCRTSNGEQYPIKDGVCQLPEQHGDSGQRQYSGMPTQPYVGCYVNGIFYSRGTASQCP